MNQVICAECRATVPQSETTYSPQGALLCGRCSQAHAAHAQVERARDAAAHQAALGRGIGDIVNLISVEAKAGSLHREIAEARHTAVQPQSTTVACFRCRTVVPRGATTLSLEGEPMCSACNAAYDPVAERKRIEGSLFLGFLWGFFLSVIGIGLVYALNRKPAEKKGAVVGAAIAFGLFYFIVVPILTASKR
ncbi:MAG: hypothetical protein IPK82_15570 [Polyangiaceae bacterium]|nr:hypothetical protein [Polyangiaceae bacterium]